jgi:hypothetical protein
MSAAVPAEHASMIATVVQNVMPIIASSCLAGDHVRIAKAGRC